ncbi:MAG: glycosyltransferase [Candidatus Jettenia sp. CY-1]|nr:MAG: glycosyltransferase [Candidatus Jettenia sp. CY-1]
MESKKYVIQTDQIKSPLISIIVTNFNYARYIETCLRSIADQTYTKFECVIVDDVSQDNSVKIIERFIDNNQVSDRFRLVQHGENQGQMAAFQTGLEHTSGRFVVFVDADDLLLPDFIETHLKAHLNSSYEAALSNSDQFQIGSDGQILSATHIVMYKNRGNTRSIAREPKNGQCEWNFSQEGPMTFRQPDLPIEYYHAWEVPQWGWMWSTTSAAMFRRDVLNMVMSEECRCLRVCADSYLFHFSHALGGTLIIPAVHGCYRRHGSNAFSNNPIIGGFNSPGDVRRDPKTLSRELSFRLAIKRFDYFHAVIGRDRMIWLLKYFGSGRKFIKLTLSLKTFPENMFISGVRITPENIFYPKIFRSPVAPHKIITRIIGRFYLKFVRYMYQMIRFLRNPRADEIKLPDHRSDPVSCLTLASSSDEDPNH